MDIPHPKHDTLLTRYIKCKRCYAIISNYQIQYQNGRYILVTYLETLRVNRLCDTCRCGLRGVRLK